MREIETGYYIKDKSQVPKKVYWKPNNTLVYKEQDSWVVIEENAKFCDASGELLGITYGLIRAKARSKSKQETLGDRKAKEEAKEKTREERDAEKKAAEDRRIEMARPEKVAERQEKAMEEIKAARQARAEEEKEVEEKAGLQLKSTEMEPFLEASIAKSAWSSLPPRKRRFDSMATLMGFREVVGASAFDGETLWFASNYGRNKSTEAVMAYLKFVAKEANSKKSVAEINTSQVIEELNRNVKYQGLLETIFELAYKEGRSLAGIEAAKAQFMASAAKATTSIIESFINPESEKALPPGVVEALLSDKEKFIRAPTIEGPAEHAEMQIIGKILEKSLRENSGGSFYIGVSKPCCPSCMAMIGAINRVLGDKIEIVPIEFEARGAHNTYFSTRVPSFMTDGTFEGNEPIKKAIQKAYVEHMDKVFGKIRGELSEAEIEEEFNRYHNAKESNSKRVQHVDTKSHYGQERMAHRRSISPISKAVGKKLMEISQRVEQKEKEKEEPKEERKEKLKEKEKEKRRDKDRAKDRKDRDKDKDKEKEKEKEPQKKKEEKGKDRGEKEKDREKHKKKDKEKGREKEKEKPRKKEERKEKEKDKESSKKKKKKRSRSRSKSRSKDKRRKKGNRSRSNLKRYEKFNLMEGYNFGDKLIESADQNQDEVNSLRLSSKAQAEEDDRALLLAEPKAEKAGSVKLLVENDHRTDHSSNVSTLIEAIKKGEITPGTVICLERKQYGKNLGMADVIMLADILKHNENHKNDSTKQIKLPDWLKEDMPIYKDAQLYNIAKERSIIVVGVEGKGLKYSEELIKAEQAKADEVFKRIQQEKESITKQLIEKPDDDVLKRRSEILEQQFQLQQEKVQKIKYLVSKLPGVIGEDVDKTSVLYNAARERAMVEKLKQIAGTRRQVIFSVGAGHKENLEAQLRQKGIEMETGKPVQSGFEEKEASSRVVQKVAPVESKSARGIELKEKPGAEAEAMEDRQVKPSKLEIIPEAQEDKAKNKPDIPPVTMPIAKAGISSKSKSGEADEEPKAKEHHDDPSHSQVIPAGQNKGGKSIIGPHTKHVVEGARAQLGQEHGRSQ